MGFAAAVAGFAQLLQNSDYIGDFDYDDILQIAQKYKSNDINGDKAEFIKIINLAKQLSDINSKQ